MRSPGRCNLRRTSWAPTTTTRDTHIDAFCHVGYEGLLYNGTPAGAVTDRGATADSIEVLENGLAGRGVLLDIPRCRGVSWLEPGEHVFREDLEEAERAQGVTVGPGDILLVRTGLVRRLNELGAWETSKAKPGLHPRAMPFLAERGVAALGCDGNSDTAEHDRGVEYPIHVLALNAMGVHLLDYLQLEELTAACEQYERWEFLFVAAPLPDHRRHRIARQPARALLNQHADSRAAAAGLDSRWPGT